MNSTELCFLPATEQAAMVRDKRISALELTQAHLAQIDRVNPKVNAIVTLDAEGALARARAADARQAKGEALGPLHGLPVAHKDLFLTRGMRTTMGSPIFKDQIPDRSMLVVDRTWNAGAICVGKTNTPEFGAGSQTFNAVFGATKNPYDLTKTCGGSSGGAGVVLATGMVPIADGSDLGASLRNPGNFCNVVGLRPSPGRVPTWPTKHLWGTLGVEGPMARTVADTALLLSVQAGPDDRVPISLMEPGAMFRAPLARDFKGVKVAFSPGFGGQIPVDRRVETIIAAQRPVFDALGCIMDDVVPDFSGAHEVFLDLRAHLFELNNGVYLDQHRDKLKETVIWNIEAGRKLSAADIARADAARSRIYERVSAFFEKWEYLVTVVNQVPPFSIDQEYVTEINGEKLATYLDWMKSCYYITITGHPAISVPAGFTADGLPVGIQIVGRRNADFSVLQLAYAFEQATQMWKRRPGVAD
ncbi:MAG: amidase [Burkholderiales bacterium]|nr:amidase [Burkholderiales bacterium]